MAQSRTDAAVPSTNNYDISSTNASQTFQDYIVWARVDAACKEVEKAAWAGKLRAKDQPKGCELP